MNLHHLALRVADPVRSARFYSDALGLDVMAEHRDDDGAVRSVWLALGDAVLMLERNIKLHGPSGLRELHGPSGLRELHGPSGLRELHGPSGLRELHGPSGPRELHGPSGLRELHGQLPGPEGSGHVLVVAVAELAAAEARIRAAGAEVADRTAYTLYFYDPDGHRVGVSVYRFAG